MAEEKKSGSPARWVVRIVAWAVVLTFAVGFVKYWREQSAVIAERNLAVERYESEKFDEAIALLTAVREKQETLDQSWFTPLGRKILPPPERPIAQDLAKFHYGKAQKLNVEGRSADALKAARAALELDPGNADVKRFIQQIEAFERPPSK